jgi:hypothetical protein
VARKKKEEDKKPVGRPTDYNLEIATRICEEIATCTDSYETICQRNLDFPERATMRRWRYKHEEFRSLYAQARADQADLFVEEIITISDNFEDDVFQNSDGDPIYLTGKVQRDRLRVDSRKWLACKMLPKIYGDKPSPEEESPFSDAERAELHAIIAGLVAKHEREY